MTTFSVLFRQTAGFESSPNNAMVTAPMMPNLATAIHSACERGSKVFHRANEPDQPGAGAKREGA